jgi:probable rRNA maturation factor
VNDHPPSPQTRRRTDVDDGSTPPGGVPTVFVIDEQAEDDDLPPLPVDTARWQALASAALASGGLGADVELSVLFVDDDAMAELNQSFMDADGPTDVLAFPIDDEAAMGADLPRLIGDVVICPRVAARNAPEHAGTYEDEVALLVVHGVLHLLGMDHADTDERVAMQARERELLANHHGRLARDPWS